MKLYCKIMFGLVLLFFMAMGTATAKVKKVPMYMFGYATSFTDSVAYITGVHQVDTVTIDEKNHFLMDRNLYSLQLQKYVEEAYKVPGCVTAIFFGNKKARLEKKFLSVFHRYEKDKSVRLQSVDYRFHSEEWVEPTLVEDESAADKHGKKHKKKKK